MSKFKNYEPDPNLLLIFIYASMEPSISTQLIDFLVSIIESLSLVNVRPNYINLWRYFFFSNDLYTLTIVFLSYSHFKNIFLPIFLYPIDIYAQMTFENDIDFN